MKVFLFTTFLVFLGLQLGVCVDDSDYLKQYEDAKDIDSHYLNNDTIETIVITAYMMMAKHNNDIQKAGPEIQYYVNKQTYSDKWEVFIMSGDYKYTFNPEFYIRFNYKGFHFLVFYKN